MKTPAVVAGVTHTLYETRHPRPAKLGDPDRFIGMVRRQGDAGDVALPIVRTARDSLPYPRCPDCGADLKHLREAPPAAAAVRGSSTPGSSPTTERAYGRLLDQFAHANRKAEHQSAPGPLAEPRNHARHTPRLLTPTTDSRTRRASYRPARRRAVPSRLCINAWPACRATRRIQQPSPARFGHQARRIGGNPHFA